MAIMKELIDELIASSESRCMRADPSVTEHNGWTIP